MYCWSLACRILSITLLACEMSAIVWQLEHCLALPFFVIELKNHLFQSCGHCSVFQICWHVECSTLTASSFKILNSSPGIPSPPLTFFIIMLPKAHSTWHSRMSGSGEWSHHCSPLYQAEERGQQAYFHGLERQKCMTSREPSESHLAARQNEGTS